jgi:enoyl-[acyl-carrier protein] reductase I
MAGFLQGKRALIVGLASNRSIAYGIAKAMAEQGAELAFTYQNDRLKERVERLTKDWSSIVLPCDVSHDDEISNLFTSLREHWDGFDILVHSVAYAPGDQLAGKYHENVSREGFRIAHDISSYSLAALVKEAVPMFRPGASVAAMTYIGSERTIPFYNTMGVAKASLEANVRYLAASLGSKGFRVNAISAGPIRTLASAGISGFKSMLDSNEKLVPMRANVTIEQVGQVTAFVCSDLASGITGEVLHVDNGFHAVGMADGVNITEAQAEESV